MQPNPEYLKQAKQILIDYGSLSKSLLMRKLKITVDEAESIIKYMQEKYKIDT